MMRLVVFPLWFCGLWFSALAVAAASTGTAGGLFFAAVSGTVGVLGFVAARIEYREQVREDAEDAMR